MSTIDSGSNQNDEIDIFTLIATIWRGKWIIAAMIAISIAMGVFYLRNMATPLYTSSAVVALASRQEQIVDFESVISGLSSDQSGINTEIEVLQSRILIGTVVDRLNLLERPEFNATLRDNSGINIRMIMRKLGLGEDAATPTRELLRERAIDITISKLSVTNIRQSKVFKISFSTQNPRQSAELANALAEAYIQSQLDQKTLATSKAIVFLTNKAEELRTQLIAAETTVRDFTASTTLIDEDVLAGKNRQIKELRTRLGETQDRLGVAMDRVAMLNRAHDAETPEAALAFLGDDALGVAAAQWQSGAINRAAFQAMVRPKQAEAQIAADRLATSQASLDTAITSLAAEIELQSNDLLRLLQLQRESEASRAVYEYFLSRLKETVVQQGVQQPDARILSDAVVPVVRSSPRTVIVLMLSIIMGGLLGLAVVLLRELRSTTIRTDTELQHISHLTVMGQIPVAPVSRRIKLLSLLIEKPNSHFVEAIRNLRSSIELSRIDQPPQVIMLTSSIPAEGKTTSSIALAQSFSGLGLRTLLIEADIRRLTFSRYFDISGEKSIVTAVEQGVALGEVVTDDSGLGMDVLPGARAKINAADFFSSAKFKAFMDEARKSYDRIIIDTPPVLAVPDARIIGRHADAILYVCRWDKTSRYQVLAGLKSLQSVNLRIDGVILSQIDSRKLRSYGYGSKSSAYGYYSTYYTEK